MFRRVFFPILVAACLLVAGALVLPSSAVVAGKSFANIDAAPADAHADPNAACAGCHRAIYKRYRTTPMANASGPAVDGLIPADFTHAASGVRYRIYEEGGKVWLGYERENGRSPVSNTRPGAPGASTDRELKGRQELQYFLGSGKRGRTYLFEQQGYWFEAPINWYAKKQIWDMTPNYLGAREMPLTLPVDPGCLHCHASEVASNLPQARNDYAGAPFAHGGITCAACHGDATAHLATGGKAHMMKIDELAPVKRDSVCLTCHLEGQAVVVRAGRRIEDFRPGDDLFEEALYFVHRDETGSGGRATSQYEALLKSQCRIQSGDKLTCTTCHDPHGSPAPGQAVSFYRQKCLQCHGGLATKHHADNPDCTACHMARPPSNDIAHEQVTDHWIKKQVSEERLPVITHGELIPVGGMAADDRDLGLAYAQMAARGDKQAGLKAMELLQRAEAQMAGAPQDHDLHAQLGFLAQMAGRTDLAVDEYSRALQADAFDSLAAGNLALLAAQQHHVADAAKLWGAVFEHDPVQLAAGFNLAVVQCGQGDGQAALATLTRLLIFAPDNQRARAMADQIRADAGRCVVQRGPR